MQQFIAKKADMLFKKRNEVQPVTPSTLPQSEEADYCAILPPIEQHMGVPPEKCKDRLFRILQVGDVVIGRIVSLKEFGLFVQLVSLCSGKERYFEGSEVIALLPAAELSDRFSKAVKVREMIYK